MKKIYLITILTVLSLLIVNVFSFRQFSEAQLNYQKSLLLEQARLCGNNIEESLDNYQNDLNRIIYLNSDDLKSIFHDPMMMNQVEKNMKYFYSKYLEFITNISIYDDHNSYLGIYVNEKDGFVVDTFTRQNKNILEPNEEVKYKDGYYYSYIPFFDQGELKGNILIEINFLEFIKNTFSLYKIDNHQWQWLITEEGTVLFTNNKGKIEQIEINNIADSIYAQVEGTTTIKAIIDGSQYNILSAYYPLNIFKNDLGIIFSINESKLTAFLGKNIFLTILNFFILLLLFVLIFLQLHKKEKSSKKLMDEVLKLRMTFQNIPIGILVLDKEGKVKSLNQSALQFLAADRPEEIIGKKPELKTSGAANDYKSNKLYFSNRSRYFFQTKADGTELTLFPIEHQVQIAGEKVTIIALIDLSPMEKSRKQDAAANHLKLHFHAKMIHELHKPLTGIVNTCELLIKKKIDREDQEKVMQIKSSADLLLSILNDLPDLSTQETPNMLLEEIPFSLSEEIDLCISTLKPMAAKKSLSLTYNIAETIPDKLIGDPIKLRKALSILIENAINQTDKGKVSLSIESKEKFNSSICLLLIIEDSGPGIPKEIATSILNDLELTNDFFSNKKKGVRPAIGIAKQLVELMNGDIWIESPAGLSDDPDFTGSRFCFTTDLIIDEKKKKTLYLSNTEHYNEITALILSMSKDEEDMAHKVLDSFGISYVYKLYEETTSDSIIRHLGQKKSLYQLLIIKDKPGFDGFSMARKIKENNLSNNYIIILISSNDQHGNYIKSHELGIDYYLIKPFQTIEILEILKENFPSADEDKSIAPYIFRIKPKLKIIVAQSLFIHPGPIQTLFKYLGYEINLANTELEILEKIEAEKYDVILIDLLISGEDGYTMCENIRNRDKDIKVIALAESEADYDRKRARDVGINDFLIKPLHIEGVKKMLINWFSEAT